MNTKVVNIYKEKFDVYIGREGKGQDGYFGNPIKLEKGEPRGSTIEKYKKYFYNRIEKDLEFKEKILSLKGKTLGCFCKPHSCHGDVIVEYLNNNMINKKRSCVIDIESNDFTENLLDFSSFPYKFLPKAELWCVVIRDLDTGEEWCAEGKEITKEWMKTTLEPFYYIIAHNGIKFDFPQLMLFEVLDYRVGYLDEPDTCFGRECRWLDSLILSRLANPDRGGHSLAIWGRRVGEYKDEYRQQCIEAGYINKDDPDGQEFKAYNPLMLPYCKQDCKTNAKVFKAIMKEFMDHDWKDSIRLEHKLADLSVRRETLGFKFDKELAEKCLIELNEKLQELADKVEPFIPPKPLNQTELNYWTPPKTQIKKNGDLGSHMINFLSRIGATCKDDGFVFEDKFYPIPYNKPLKESVKAEMKDFDHIKMHLISLGWDPIEWSERDMTKDSKKKNLSFEKRQAVLDRWWKDTTNGKYKKHRLEGTEIKGGEQKIYEKLQEKLQEKWPVRVYTSPKIRVGIEKDLCPNLVKLGEKVSFAKDFADWLTYRHRRNAIAGGVLDEDTGVPSSGFLSAYREVDGRVPTPSIEIGASTNRYTHKIVANIPRASSTYGKEMRSLFRAGEGAVFFGFDYSSLENRIQGSYIFKYPGGPEMAESLVAEKPNDSHSLNAIKLGIPRSEVKSFTYAVLYGAAAAKIKKMLGVSLKEAKQLIDDFWNGNPALNSLKKNLEKYWESKDKKFVLGIDGRKIRTRSKHSLLNALFQSGGVIFAKYVSVYLMQKMEEQGYCIDPFIGKPDICSMIEYHDEQDMYANPKLFQFQLFDSEEEAKSFVKNWTGDQLSAISEGKNGKYFVSLPSPVSRGIEDSMEIVKEKLNISVDMGFEYMLGNNWYECH